MGLRRDSETDDEFKARVNEMFARHFKLIESIKPTPAPRFRTGCFLRCPRRP
jgi:hypothetical protein